MRPKFVLLMAAAVLAFAGITAGSAAAPYVAPSRQEIAQRILNSRAVLTAAALARLQMVARGDHRVVPDPPKNPVKGAKPGKSGHFSGGQGMANTRVNNTGEDSNQTDQTTQSETTIAVSGSNVVVGYNDSQTTLQPFFSAASNLSGVAYSQNGGSTFVDGGAIPNAPAMNNVGDPWVAADAPGNFYYSQLVEDFNNFALDVGVAKSTDGGKSWGVPTIVPPPAGISSLGYFADKDAMAAGAGSLVDSWDDFTVTPDLTTGGFTVLSGLPVARSTDGGQTWTTVYADQVPVFVFNPTAPPDCSFHQYIGAQPMVLGDGTIYDAALRFDVSDPTCVFPPPSESELIFKSTDGGKTFTRSDIADNIGSATQGFGAFVLGPGQFTRDLEFPTLAARNGNLYAAWNDGSAGDGNSHIRLATSTDGGSTWTTSFVTSGSNNEAQPALSADSSGVHILHYTISPNPSGDGTSVLDAFVENSANGRQFTPTRVTTQSFPGVFTVPQFDPIIAFGYMGDYIATTSDGKHQYFAWGDNRDLVKNFLWPNGRNDPDVFFAQQ
jgi:hypothetical protein